MAAPDPHDMMTCPYNKAHQVEHYRMHVHLQKCRKQYPNCNKVTCPFDATHIVNDVELDYHVNSCRQRVLFDTQVYVDADDARTPVTMMSPPPAHLQTEESWDDANVASYKPDPTKKASHVLIKAKGLAPAERRKVRMEGVRTYKGADEPGNSN